MKLIKVGVACVNQTPFAWDENFAHLRMAIEHARAEGVTVLCLPELAITGYGCEDAFFMDGLQDVAFAQRTSLGELDPTRFTAEFQQRPAGCPLDVYARRAAAAPPATR